MREKKDYAFLQPVQIGNRTFKNRIIYPAMGKHLATKDGFVTEEYIEYFRSVARGGAGNRHSGHRSRLALHFRPADLAL